MRDGLILVEASLTGYGPVKFLVDSGAGATLIDRHTEAIFVGEPTGSSPTFVGESVEFLLPYSKLLANVSDLLWQTGWPMDCRRWIAPAIYTPPTFADFRRNRDPAMEAILSIREHVPGW